MPDKTGRLTPMERKFIEVYAMTQDATYAATKAGYKTPQVLGYQKIANPEISQATKRVQAARLNNELLPVALNLIHTFLTDETRNDRVRLTAAQTVLKYTFGLNADGSDAKEPHEMTQAELQARIDTLRRAAADKARPVLEGQAIEGPDSDVFG